MIKNNFEKVGKSGAVFINSQKLGKSGGNFEIEYKK